MPIPAQRDLELSRLSFRDWLATTIEGATDVDVAELDSPSGSGFSNETLFANVSWKADGREHTDSLVVRVKPTGFQVFYDADFELQFRLLQTLGAETDVPVPQALWFESDPAVLGAPFFVMRRIAGRAPTDQPPYNEAGWLFDSTEAERAQLWRSGLDALIAVHKVPLETVAFLAKPELGETGLDQLITFWQRSFDWAAAGRPQPIAERAWEWLLANLPANRATSLSWGDSRVGNILFDDGRVTAVVDWEMLSLGGHMVDLGWWLFLDDYHTIDAPRLAGLGNRADTIAIWEAGTGEKADDLEWYEIFAGFRFTVVMMRLCQMLEDYGVMAQNDFYNEANNPVSRLLGQKVDLVS